MATTNPIQAPALAEPDSLFERLKREARDKTPADQSIYPFFSGALEVHYWALHHRHRAVLAELADARRELDRRADDALLPR